MKKSIKIPNTMSALKRILFCVAMLLPVLSAKAVGDDVFKDLADQKNVESTYVSGRFSQNMKRWDSQTGSRSIDLSRGFSSMYIYQCYSSEAVSNARKLLDNFLSKHKNIDLLIRTKQLQAEFMIYEMVNDEGKIVKGIVWNSDAPGTCEIVVINWEKGLIRDHTTPYSFDDSENHITKSNRNYFYNYSGKTSSNGRKYYSYNYYYGK